MGILKFLELKEEVDTLLQYLQSPSEKEREQALEKLSDLQLSVNEGLKILEAAKNKFPPDKFEWRDMSAQLIDICAEQPYFEYIAKVEKIFDCLNPYAKISSFHFLSGYDNEQALITYLKLLGKDYEKLHALPAGDLKERPRYPEILFPRLLKYSGNKAIASDIYLILLSYLENGLVSEASMGEYRSMVIGDIQEIARVALNYKTKFRHKSFWDDEGYLELRSRAAIHIELAGHIRDPRVIMTLRSLMGIGDIKLRMCTAISMVRLGQHLEARDMVEVAADREVRNCFYDKLEILGNHDIFPEEYKTQEAFAESNMVNWLTYPTELGRVPDEIQLMNVFDTGGEEYYLFRFKCTSSEDWVEKGWMVGVSGPFDKRFKPTTTAEGHTFSHFGRWEDNTPEEHFDTIIGSIRRYWVRQP